MQADLVKFDHLREKVTSLLAPLSGIQVRDRAENAIAKGALVTVKGIAKEIEAVRSAALAPYREATAQINFRAKMLMDILEDREREIKRVMFDFAAIEQRRLEEERRKADEAAAAERNRLAEEDRKRKRIEEEEAAARAAFGVDTNAEVEDGIRRADELAARLREEAAARRRAEEKRLEAERPKNTRTVWHFEVIEAERLDIPMQFWKIDESAIGAAVRGGAREIPGVKIWSTQEVVARA